eukprot:SAG11_NODE_298_length_11076_cov_4.253621_12_plen_212_part_00
MPVVASSHGLGRSLLASAQTVAPATAAPSTLAVLAEARFYTPLPATSRCATVQPAMTATAAVALCCALAAAAAKGMLSGKGLGASGAVVLGALGLLHLQFGRVQPVRVTHCKTSWVAAALAKMPSLLQGYRPPPYLPTGILQTIGGTLMAAPQLRWRREKIALPALQRPREASCCPEMVPRGEVSLDWLDHTEADAELLSDEAVRHLHPTL